jgi:uncharacterized Zn finger protein
LADYAKRSPRARKPCFRAHLQREAAVSLCQWLAEQAWEPDPESELAYAITVAKEVMSATE